MDPYTSPKIYGSVLKSFHKNKKIPCITPNKNRVITISKKKLTYLILFFAKQCSVIDNSREISSDLQPKTDKS